MHQNSISALPSGLPRVGSFGGDERGTVAVIFALILIPILGIISLSIDYGRASHVQAGLQKALDAAVFAVQRVGDQPEADLQALFQANFRANLPKGYEKTAGSAEIDKASRTVDAIAQTSVPTTLMAIMGRKSLDVKVTARARLRKSPNKRRRAAPPVARAPRSGVRRAPGKAAAPPQIKPSDLMAGMEKAMNDPSVDPQIRARIRQMMQQLQALR